MPAYYTVDVNHSGSWYQWDLTFDLSKAINLYNEYILDDTFDGVALNLHLEDGTIKTVKITEYESLPW